MKLVWQSVNIWWS